MRAAIAALLLVAACSAQEGSAPRAALDPLFNPDDFTVAGNACGASAYADLVGEPYGELQQAALPSNARVIAHNMANTLEYAPSRTNVILDGRGRIAAIGVSDALGSLLRRSYRPRSNPARSREHHGRRTHPVHHQAGRDQA